MPLENDRSTGRGDGMPALQIGAADAAALLDYPALIEALDAAFRGDYMAPARAHHRMAVPGGSDATLLLMPAWSPGRYVGVKVAQVFPDNGAHGLPAVQSVYLLSSGRTGALLATIDGGELTSRRTVAASALAARRLARPDAARLLVVGTGEIARRIAAAHAAVRPIRDVAIWGRDAGRAEALAEELARDGFEARAVSDLEAAVAGADIVSCGTLSRTPLVEGAWLRPGVHLDLIGAFTPEMRETDDAAVVRASVFVDTAAAIAEAGDLVQPLRSGAIDRSHIRADLADLAAGRHGGRRDPNEITLFKSVGASLEDLAGAMLCYERARDRRP
jgi:ornithine cyclodeaminase